MTKEQEESIEKIKRQILIGECGKNIGMPVFISDLKNVLAMLKEKDNRINQLENMNEFQSKDIKKIVDYTFELNKEIEQQDKIIDLMSEQLTTPVHDKEYVKQYFENKAKE
ncbi:MAG TPA: hypothetical protein OIM45_04920 [Clostridiaceae bacterium]|nr:hypothetical protein [Clostridiaceae bacterium]